MTYEHRAGKMPCAVGTQALCDFLDGASAEGWELVAFETCILGGGPIVIPGQQAQAEPGWFFLLRRRVAVAAGQPSEN